MSIYKYYLKLPTLEALNAVLLETLGTTSSTKDFTVVPVSEPLTRIGGSEDEPIYSDPSGCFVYANVYSPEPIEWPEGVAKTPAAPWSDLN